MKVPFNYRTVTTVNLTNVSGEQFVDLYTSGCPNKDDFVYDTEFGWLPFSPRLAPYSTSLKDALRIASCELF